MKKLLLTITLLARGAWAWVSDRGIQGRINHLSTMGIVLIALFGCAPSIQKDIEKIVFSSLTLGTEIGIKCSKENSDNPKPCIEKEFRKVMDKVVKAGK